MRRFKFVLFFLLCTIINGFAQETGEVEMADALRRDGKIYTVVTGLVIILTAMIVLLIRVDRRLFRLENEFKAKKNT